jgi:hypothetical protein
VNGADGMEAREVRRWLPSSWTVSAHRLGERSAGWAGEPRSTRETNFGSLVHRVR